MGKIKNREGQIMNTGESQESCLKFLYETVVGRCFLKVLTKPIVSKIVGCYMNSIFSCWLIDKFVKNSAINMSDFEKCKYKSYNEFFTRKIKPEKRPMEMESKVFISPCDSKLAVYEIDEHSIFHIKGAPYTVKDLLAGDELYKEYEGGYCMIFRLTVDDYHRYCYVDNGIKGENIFIPGELHTVNPIALERYNFYKRNCREYSVLTTENFDRIVQIEVGAMMVGKILNHHGTHSFTRGEEKGMFEFGGSTTVLLVKKDQIQVDEDILANTKENIETVVKLGERIGCKL